MKPPKISSTLPDRITIGGKTLIRKSLYKGKILEKTPELEKELSIIRKRISELQIELYKMEKTNSMFIRFKNVQNAMTTRMNDIASEIRYLKRQQTKLMQECLNAQ